MKICIIGGGISGLSVAQLLKKFFEVEVFEKNSFLGGIAHVKMVNDIPYHVVGGHCFNSKNRDVIDFVFNNIMKESYWNQVKRKSQIYFHGNLIDYPIEYSIKQIAEFDIDLALRMTSDFFKSTSQLQAKNLSDWFRNIFGNTLADEYMIPYNKKIWGIDPSEMDYSWVEDKLPIPNNLSFFRGLVSNEKDSMPHSSFYYPKSNTQNSFIDCLASGLNILLDYPVLKLEQYDKKWIVNGEKVFDKIISTMPLNQIHDVIVGSSQTVKDASDKLKFNRVSNLLWETDGVDNTWTYFPDKSSIFHRHIHIGNFITPVKNYTITEAIGNIDESSLIREGREIPYLLNPVDYNVSEHAYVVFDKNNISSKKIIRSYLESIGICTLGRFGEWDYYNMDVCIEKAMQLSNKLLSLLD